MKCLQPVLAILAVLIVARAFSALGAEPTPSSGSQRGDLPVLMFRGATPGQTTEAALLNDPQWGKPESRDTLRDDMTLLRYQVSKLPVRVAVRGGVVRSIDVLFPPGAAIDEVVSVFELKDPLPEGQLPTAALVGEPIPERLKARRYGSGRAVLFVEQAGEHPLVKRVRFYGPDQVIVFGPFSTASIIGQPGERDRQITRAVASLLPQSHLSGHPLDDTISRRCLELFLKRLDPVKVYFLQSDVDRLQQHETDLDDMVKSGDVTFAYLTFEGLIQRIKEHQVLIDRALAMEHDFTVDEAIVRDPNLSQYPRDETEAWEKWRKRIKFELLVLKAEGVEGEQAQKRLFRRYRSFAERMHQTTTDELLELYLTSMATAFDPHSTYKSPATMENFKISARLELNGIGAELVSEDGDLVVRRIIPGSPAEKDGRLAPQDRIIRIKKDPTSEMVDVVGRRLADVVGMIRGTRGTVVQLEVVSADTSDRELIDITRGKVELASSTARGEIFEEGRKPGGKPYRVGVIDLPTFYTDAGQYAAKSKSSSDDIRRILQGFTAEKVDAVVLDLRRNAGGMLDEAIKVTGLFIDRGPVMQVKGPDGQVQPRNDPERGTPWSGPLIVLISRFSASGSEILAGAIQDYRRGLIIGDRATHGKGTVTSAFDLGQRLSPGPDAPRLGAIFVTTHQFYRPSGDSVQNRGVSAEVELPSASTHLDIGEVHLDYSLPFDRVEPLGFERLGYVNEGICNELNRLSADRRAASEDFQRATQNIDRFKKQKIQKSITLNEQEFMAHRAEVNAYNQEHETIRKMTGLGEAAIERTFYLDEVLAITADYVRLFRRLE